MLTEGGMTRWRVKASRRTPTWFHAVEVFFLDAETAEGAARIVEGRSVPGDAFEAWEVTAATPAMEAQHLDWLRRCELWREHAKHAMAKRGMV
jgi:hypothetical protein